MDVKENDFHDEIDLEELIRVLWQRKAFIVVVVFLSSILAYLLIQQMPNIYRSQVTIMFKKSPQSGDAIQSLLTGGMTAADSTETELELVKNKNLLQKVVEELNLLNHKEFQSINQKGDTEIAPSELLELKTQTAISIMSKNTSVKQKSGTDLVTIAYDARDPILAAKVAKKWQIRLVSRLLNLKKT
jgi:uncharacterized protein involved in exopolysaccharide biosynthesis